MNEEGEHLVFFETSGNQAYIYATNKLRENVGASELTYRAGTQWVLEAAGFPDAPTDKPVEFRQWLKKGPSQDGVEVVLATSGKALLVVSSRERAHSIVSTVTKRAAKEAPGLAITGAIVPLPGRDKETVSSAIQEAHDRFNANRDLMSTPAQRFQMLPFCQPCSTSGLPAGKLEGEDAYATPSAKKRKNAEGWFSRIREVFRNGKDGFFPAAGADHLESQFDDLSWFGVIFADGNGLGQIMMQFKKWLEPNDDYLTTYRNFSIELDEATEKSFYAACVQLHTLGASRKMKGDTNHRLPVVPLLLGGDDLTVMVDGRYALPFAQTFLTKFEESTAASPTISRIAQKALCAPRLSAGAGVAIVKKHFPYHSAHALAASLLKSAKLCKEKVRHNNLPYPCSALDFHVLFDSTFTDLKALRARRMAQDGAKLWGGPYVTTSLALLSDAVPTDWAGRHSIEHLLSRITVLQACDADGRRRLPNGQMHMLRESLAAGRTVADARLQELRWLDASGMTELIEDGDSLFFTDEDKDATRFLDALTASAFWPTEAHEESEGEAA
jgi:hypothetical protein